MTTVTSNVSLYLSLNIHDIDRTHYAQVSCSKAGSNEAKQVSFPFFGAPFRKHLCQGYVLLLKAKFTFPSAV